MSLPVLLVLIAEPAYSQALLAGHRRGWKAQNSGSLSSFFGPRGFLPRPRLFLRDGLFGFGAGFSGFRAPRFGRGFSRGAFGGFLNPSGAFTGYTWPLPSATQLPDDTQRFVEQWSRPDPSVSAASVPFESSGFLKLDMRPEEVMPLLGSPLFRTQLEGREIWKYSAYSLYFEQAKLRGFR
jgi:hypothetical protein